MGDWPSTLLPPFPIITTTSEEALGTLISGAAATSSPLSGVLTQNAAYFYPFRLDIGATAVKMCYIVGATANGNIDLGIYDAEFNLLVSSGLTAQGTTNTLQELDITDTELHPGNYWMAISLSSASGTAFRISVADELIVPVLAGYRMASASPLPSTATPAKTTAAIIVAMGVSFDTLI